MYAFREQGDCTALPRDCYQSSCYTAPKMVGLEDSEGLLTRLPRMRTVAERYLVGQFQSSQDSGRRGTLFKVLRIRGPGNPAAG